MEDPVRRHIYTSSVAGASAQGAHTLARMRGFELLPNYVDFGVLKEGNTYAFPVHLKNTGIDACRFRVKQPPPSTGLRVLFRPGPVGFVTLAFVETVQGCKIFLKLIFEISFLKYVSHDFVIEIFCKSYCTISDFFIEPNLHP